MRKQNVTEEIRVFNQIYGNSGKKFFIDDWLIDFLGFKEIKRDQRGKIRLLEVGCGVGRHSLELAKLGYQVTGLDISEQGIRIARKKAREENLSVHFICTDAQKTNLPDLSFDMVLFIDSLHHFYYRGFYEVIKETKRLLKKGGQLVLSEPNHLYPYNFISFNLAHFCKKYFREFTQNERSLDPYQLRCFFEKDFRLINLLFFNYNQFIADAVLGKKLTVLRQMRKVINWLFSLLPVPFGCDHFIMKLKKK